MEEFLQKVRKFFNNTKTVLIVIICILAVILIFQNIFRYTGHRPPNNFNGSRVNNSSSMKFPGMMGGGAGGGMNRYDR